MSGVCSVETVVRGTDSTVSKSDSEFHETSLSPTIIEALAKKIMTRPMDATACASPNECDKRSPGHPGPFTHHGSPVPVRSCPDDPDGRHRAEVRVDPIGL